MGNVTQTFSGDITQLQRCYASLVKDNVRLEQELQKVAKAFQASSDQMTKGLDRNSSAMGGMMGRIQGLAAGWMSIQSAVQLGNMAIEHQIALGERIRTGHVSVGASSFEVVSNISHLPLEQQKEIPKRIEKIQQETKFPNRELMNSAFAEAVSANGGDVEKALNSVKAAAEYTRIKPEDLSDVTMLYESISKITGETDRKRILGRALALQQQSRPKGIHGISRYGVPSIGQAGTFYDDPEKGYDQPAAYWSTVTDFTEDVKGMESRTHNLSMHSQLDKFFSEGVKKHIGARTYHVKPPSNPKEMLGWVDALRANPKMRKEFLEGASFERQHEPFVKNLLDPEKGAELLKKGLPDPYTVFKSRIGKMSPDLDAADTSYKMMKEGSPQIIAANRDAAQKADVQIADLNDRQAATDAQARKIVDDYASSTKGAYSYLGAQLQKLNYKTTNFFGGDPVANAEQFFEFQEKSYASSPDELERIRKSREQLETLKRPEHLRREQKKILSDADQGRGVMRRDQLSDEPRAKFDSLENRVEGLQRQSGDPVRDYETEEAIKTSAGRKARLDRQKRELAFTRDMLGRGNGWGIDAKARHEAKRREFEHETRAEFLTQTKGTNGFAKFGMDWLTEEPNRTKKFSDDLQEQRTSSVPFAMPDSLGVKIDQTNVKLDQLIEAVRSQSSSVLPTRQLGVSAGRANAQSGTQSER